MTDPNKVLLSLAAAGKDAEDFMKSELGQQMVVLARTEAIAALTKLRTISPWRRRRISQLQAEIWRAESFEGWMKSLAARGQQALREYDRRTAAIYEEEADGTPDSEHPETHNDD